jgi:hypothetical protein
MSLDKSVALSRVSTGDRSVDEAWIQRLMLEHPAVLPILELDESFSPPIPIGREIPTSAGPIDVLYITPSGNLTVVEAKLWRNSQARREVIGQIIDYATALAEFGYDTLDQASIAANEMGLWELVGDHDLCPFDSEDELIDAVAANLRTGRFLLLVVGDGIRHEVERMAAYVQAAPQLRFSLALVELRLFEIPGESRRVVVPSIVARTEEVTRAVVSVSVDSIGDVQVDVSVPSDDSSGSRGKLTEDDFFSELGTFSSTDEVRIAERILDDFRSRSGFVINWGTASYIVKYRSPSDDRLLTLFVVTRDNKIYPGWLDQQLPKSGYELQIGHDFISGLASVVGLSVHPKNPLSLDGSFTLARFDDQYAEIDRLTFEFIEALDEAT